MYPHQPPQPPPIVIQHKGSRATTIGVWIIVAWIVGPVVLIGLCCAGCIGIGGIGAITGDSGSEPTPTVTSTR